jgi:hypothetical protein
MGLKEDQKIKSKGNSYTLVIPSFSDPLVQSFYQDAKMYAGSAKGKERIEKFIEYVSKNIEAERGWEKGAKKVSLLSSLGLRRGVCKERAAILSMILTLDGFENQYKRGLVPDGNDEIGRHAWVKVKIDDKFWLADPSFGPRFGDYESVTRFNRYEEDENFLKLLFKKLKRKVN